MTVPAWNCGAPLRTKDALEDLPEAQRYASETQCHAGL